MGIGFMKFKIFAGLGGGFGGAHYVTTENVVDECTALDWARSLAWKEYESYGGMYGLFNREEELEENPEYEEGDLIMLEEEDFDSWAEYYVEEVK